MSEVLLVFTGCAVVLGGFALAAAYVLFSLKKSLIQSQEQLKKVHANEQVLTSELAAFKNKFSQEVLRDAVTGLPSASVFKDQVNVILTQSQRHNTIFGILFLNLKNFKMVNNSLGYTTGDAVLKEVAHRLQASMRQIDSACRYSGDTFIVLLSQLSHPESAALVVHRLLQELSQPFFIDRYELSVPANIGISIYPTDGRDVDTLLRNAAQALAQSKEAGGQQYQFYQADMQEQSRRELMLNSALCQDSIFQDIHIEYQPQMNLENNKIFCWEVLLRWQHPDFGAIPAREFIRLAENNGRMEALGEWILQRVCHQLQLWQSMGCALPSVAINISFRQLESPHFISTILRILQETHVDPKSLIFEVAEEDVLKRSPSMEKVFTVLHQIGIKIGVDHFGGGDVLLRYIKDFPVDYLKIDSAFVRDVTTSKESEAIITMMLMLANSLNKKMIALGVETEAQKELLQQLGCTLMQGYLFSPPLKESEVLKKLRASAPKPVQEDNLTVS